MTEGMRSMYTATLCVIMLIMSAWTLTWRDRPIKQTWGEWAKRDLPYLLGICFTADVGWRVMVWLHEVSK